ncbi:MAG: response regulator [Myxococcota bacterium]
MADPRKILIADGDVETVRALKQGLEPEFKVIAARDGSKALELSITEFPDLIMVYRHCPLISAKQFLRILRTNPRTESIPLIILSDETVSSATLPGYLEGILVKPLNLDEVRAHLNSVFTRADAAREVGQESGAVQGSLTQISMVDLVQVFAMNRRSGCIRLSSNGETAEVFVADGRIEDAKIGLARGEKALYRILSWASGAFPSYPKRRRRPPQFPPQPTAC